MKTKACHRCKEETPHHSEPVQHPLSDEAILQTCDQCGARTTVIPNIDTLNVTIRSSPRTLSSDAIVIDHIDSVVIDGRNVDFPGPFHIRIKPGQTIVEHTPDHQ